MSKEFGTVSNDMVAVDQPGWRAFQDVGQALLALEQRLEQQILSVEVEEIKREVDQPLAFALSCRLHQAERRGPVGAHGAKFAFEIRPRDGQCAANLPVQDICLSS